MTTRTPTPRNRVADGRRRTGSTIAAEAIKLWSLPAQRTLLLVAIALAASSAAVLYVSLPITQGRALAELDPSQILEVGILGVDVAAFAVIVLAAGHVGSEYSTGLIQTTLTLTPSRWRVVAGKLVTAALAALVVGVAAAVLCVLTAIVAGATAGVDAGSILTASGVQLAVGSIAMPVVYAIIAAAGAFVFRSTALGIVTPLVVMAIGGFAGWFGETTGAIVTPLMPVSAIHTLAGTATGPEAIGAGAACVSVVVWIGLSATVSAWRLLRHDA